MAADADLPPLTVLATSVGNDGFPSVLDALKSNGEREIRVVGVDIRPSAAGLLLADRGELLAPRSESDKLIAQLLELCDDESVDLLLPLSTEDQEFFAARRADFTAHGVATVVSSLKSLVVANDKLALLDACSNAGISCPRYVSVASVGALEAAATELGYPDVPVVVKLNRGTGAQGVKIVLPTLDPLARLFDRDNIRVGLSDVIAGLRTADPFPALHVAEYLPGQELSVDVLCHNGTVDAVVVRDRLAALYGLATHAIVIDQPAAARAATAVVELLGLSYVINVQLRGDAAGTPRLMETNPRIPGTIALTVAAGVNMPYLALKLALGERFEPPPPPAIGTELIRHWATTSRRPAADG